MTNPTIAVEIVQIKKMTCSEMSVFSRMSVIKSGMLPDAPKNPEVIAIKVELISGRARRFFTLIMWLTIPPVAKQGETQG